jgi:ATP synthase F1 complex assembly factor 1
MDLSRFVATPHTGAQIGELWNAYHAAKAGAGKGYLSAVIPRATYESFLPISRKYPSFILPLPRPDAQIDLEANQSNPSSSQTPYEFYYMEWAQHLSPPLLDVQTSDPFTMSKNSKPSPNPPCTTIIFTPLQEYKLRQSFAVPHLVLTHYTDLAHTHDVVLMRGELTIGDSGRTWLSSSDAQLMAFGVQQFYLGETARGGELLKMFHEKPDQFSWEELISISQL